jgi:hypothetical protein
LEGGGGVPYLDRVHESHIWSKDVIFQEAHDVLRVGLDVSERFEDWYEEDQHLGLELRFRVHHASDGIDDIVDGDPDGDQCCYERLDLQKLNYYFSFLFISFL